VHIKVYSGGDESDQSMKPVLWGLTKEDDTLGGPSRMCQRVKKETKTSQKQFKQSDKRRKTWLS